MIRYAAPLLDYSGYGECSRHHVAAMTAAGIEVNCELLSYSTENSDYGTLGQVAHEAIKRSGEYKVKLIHSTPDEIPRLLEPGKYHVGFCYWETDKIPQLFAQGLNQVDEIWTGSKANFDAIRNGGVSKPIHIIPEPIETERDWPKPYVIPDFDGYLFYSIFEWTDRKNPELLIKAFLDEFKNTDGVGLIIKTYFRNFSLSNKKMIRNKIEMLRNEIGVDYKKLPIFLYLDLMDRNQIMRLHMTGDCFVSPHRGEGWGIPQVEAMLAGNPIISTNYGGVHEYLSAENAYLLPFKMEKLRGMEHSQRFYAPDQHWANVDIEILKGAMRQVFDNQKDAKQVGINGRKFAGERFNLKRVGKEMADRIKLIERDL